MRPSDKVWKGISANLKRRNRRIGWIASMLLLITSLSGYFLAQYGGLPNKPILAQGQDNGARPASPASGSARSEAGTGASARLTTSNTTASAIDPKPATQANDMARTELLPAATENGLAANNFQDFGFNNSLRTGTAAHNLTAGAGRGSSPLRLVHSARRRVASKAGSASLAASIAGLSPDPGIGDHFRTDASLEKPLRPRLALADAPVVPNSADVAIKITKPSKMAVQFFFTPTISYRKLTENRDYTSNTPPTNSSPNYSALYNINEAVTHKPNIGLELGLTAKYPVAHNLKVQGGIQFNMSRYDVQAFDNWVNEPATMALRNGQTSIRPTPYSNFNGGKRDWLQNLYFQVSAPIGLELKLAGNEKTQFGIASTFQPTYVLGDRVYALSTDYKNYAEVPWLMRRWNLNTSVVTYVSYATRKLNWQVGPQVRYQVLSSFVSKYPVKENLFDFGLRVGVTFNKLAGAARSLK